MDSSWSVHSGEKKERSHLSYAKGRKSWAEPEVTFPDPSEGLIPSLAHHRTQPSYRLSPIYSSLFSNGYLGLFIDLETGSIYIYQ